MKGENMRLETLVILRQCLHGQTLRVGDPSFPETAPQVLAALVDLNEAIDAASVTDWPMLITDGPPDSEDTPAMKKARLEKGVGVV